MTNLTPAEIQTARALMKELKAAIEEHSPAIAAMALTSTLATLIGALASDPIAQAKFQASALLRAVERPPEWGSVN